MGVSSIYLNGVAVRNEDERLVVFVPKRGQPISLSKDKQGNWETVDDCAAIVEMPSHYLEELEPGARPLAVRCIFSISNKLGKDCEDVKILEG